METDETFTGQVGPYFMKMSTDTVDGEEFTLF